MRQGLSRFPGLSCSSVHAVHITLLACGPETRFWEGAYFCFWTHSVLPLKHVGTQAPPAGEAPQFHAVADPLGTQLSMAAEECGRGGWAPTVALLERGG